MSYANNNPKSVKEDLQLSYVVLIMTTKYFQGSLNAANDNPVRISYPDTDTNSDTTIEKPALQEREIEQSSTRRIFQLIFITLSFIGIGLNDSATGSNLSNIQERYGLSFKDASFLFLSNAGGYAISSVCTVHIMYYFGVSLTIFVSAIIYSGGALLTAFAPPFPAMVVSLFCESNSSRFEAI